MPKLINLKGRTFERLTVINQVSERRNGAICWLCKCACGKETIVRGGALRNHSTKSCGCWNRDRVTSHGLRKHPLYGVWRSMKKRCYDPNNASYKHYGGRGIRVCNEWKDNVKAFIDWALIVGYKKGLFIDRKDNGQGYYPGNCHFVTMKESNRNMSTVRLSEKVATAVKVLYEETDVTQQELADVLGVTQSNISYVVHNKTWQK